MGWLSRLLGGGGEPQAPAMRARSRIVWRDGSYPTRAVGESFYQPALEMLCGGRHSRNGFEVTCEAHLVPEPTNPHDANAVQVLIRGSLVGHLSRDDAMRFHAEMALASRPGEGARCAAMINGGWRTNQHDEGSFGVRLGVPGRGRFILG